MLICFLQLIIIILAIFSFLMVDGFWIDIPLFVFVAIICFIIAKKYENKPKMKTFIGIILIFNCSIYLVVVALSGNAPFWYDALHLIIAIISTAIIKTIRGREQTQETKTQRDSSSVSDKTGTQGEGTQGDGSSVL